MKSKTCCFTGHRDIPAEKIPAIKKRLEDEIINLISQGVINFKTGGARGFDTIAAISLIKLKKIFPQIRLIVILPYRKTGSNGDCILSQSDEIRYASEYYHKGCMQKRNRCLVDNSGHCICYLTKTGGGTKYTVDYAKKKGLNIIRIMNLS